MACLAPKAKVLRAGLWNEEYAAVLVFGDIISIKLGLMLVSLRSSELSPKFDLQSGLIGESLPVTKGPGDGVCSGSTVKQGEIDALVIATSAHTFFGKASHRVDST
ncbi:hypothetical protein Pfo_018274 [Paulownia fortunei]|nr:hypothetical protein Pfo_018274 [Paulownia fortunei]